MSSPLPPGMSTAVIQAPDYQTWRDYQDELQEKSRSAGSDAKVSVSLTLATDDGSRGVFNFDVTAINLAKNTEVHFIGIFQGYRVIGRLDLAAQETVIGSIRLYEATFNNSSPRKGPHA